MKVAEPYTNGDCVCACNKEGCYCMAPMEHAETTCTECAEGNHSFEPHPHDEGDNDA